MEREEEWNEGIGEQLCVCEREWEGKWKLEKLKVWKLGKRKWGIKYQANWKYEKCEKYVTGKYKENWKYSKYEKYELGKYQKNWKYGNLENRKWENIKKIKKVWKV